MGSGGSRGSSGRCSGSFRGYDPQGVVAVHEAPETRGNLISKRPVPDLRNIFQRAILLHRAVLLLAPCPLMRLAVLTIKIPLMGRGAAGVVLEPVIAPRPDVVRVRRDPVRLVLWAEYVVTIARARSRRGRRRRMVTWLRRVGKAATAAAATTAAALD